MADVAPIDKSSKEETFTDLAKDFNLDDKVKTLFLNGSMENLEDFRYYFSSEAEIDAFVAADTTLQGADLRIQISRVRRVWAAIRHNGVRKEIATASPPSLSWTISLRREPSGKSK